MAHPRLPLRFASSATKCRKTLIERTTLFQHRRASDLSTPKELSNDAEPPRERSTDDLEFPERSYSSLQIPGPSEDIVKSFNPAERARSRTDQLPPSRYVSSIHALILIVLIIFPAINFDPLNTTVAPSTLINLRPAPPPNRGNSSLVPFPSLGYGKLMNRLFAKT